MSDLVERLRAGHAIDGIPLYDKAADEIERLTEEVTRLRHALDFASETMRTSIPDSCGRNLNVSASLADLIIESAK